jgi:predicted small lipoprotein YifL
MKKYFVWFGAFFLVLVLSGCGKKGQNANNENDLVPATKKTENVQKENESSLFSGTIKDLMAKGTSMQCAWSTNNEANKDLGKVSGTIYVSGTKFFQEYFSVQPQVGEVKAYVLNDGEWIYQWSSLSKNGTKMKTAEVEQMAKDVTKNMENGNPNGTPPNDQGPKNEAMDFNNKFDYSCQKWSVDSSKFQLPSDILFQDVSEMLKALPKVGKQNKVNACQMCNSLPAGAKATCLDSCQK